MATGRQALIATLTVTKIQLRTLNERPCGCCELATDFGTPQPTMRDNFAQPSKTKGEIKRFYNFEYLDFVIGDFKTRHFKINVSKHLQNLNSTLFLSSLF